MQIRNANTLREFTFDCAFVHLHVFSAISNSGNKICDFLFASLD